jgi:cell division septation protein DedD
MADRPSDNRGQTDPKKSPRRLRSRYASSESGGRMPRIFILAAAVLLVGAAIMFWPRGGGEIPTGIGERITVVADDDSNTARDATPRSGDVELSQERAQLVPETPQSAPATQPPARRPQAGGSDTGGSASAAGGDRERSSSPPVRVVPSDEGPWAVQVGAFGDENNAQALVTRLISQGYPARMRAASTSGGDIVFRVWIGYFASRSAAATFARQHRDQIGDANPVHR